MITLAIILYVVSCLGSFLFLIKKGKKDWGYVNKEDLFFISFGSLIWPIGLTCYLIYQFFCWMERVINGQ